MEWRQEANATLAGPIECGPIPMEDALNIARNIREALGVVREKGIKHRELKPAKIKLTPAEGA